MVVAGIAAVLRMVLVPPAKAGAVPSATSAVSSPPARPSSETSVSEAPAPDTLKALHEAGVEPSLSTPEAMQQLLASEIDKWGKVVRETGVKVD